MSTLPVVLLGLGMLLAKDAPAAETPDFAALREMLQDRQHPRNQSQAALLLVQSHAPEAESIVREGLRQTETPETFLALAATLRLFPDTRYQPELLEALVRGKPVIRQSAAEALALLADDDLVKHLQALAEDGRVDLAVRKAAVWTLGRSGRKQAALVLLDQLSSNQEVLRLEAAEALADLTGQSFGDDSSAWQAWWEGHQDFSNERWLSERLFYQATRARRLEGELERARGQLVRLHQQLYARLPGADRLGYIQTLAEQEDPNLRVQAVAWSVELLPATDNVGQRTLANALLRLSDDAVVEVQRSATLALGGVLDARAFDRLTVLIGKGLPEVRVAAARALTQQAQRAWEGAKTPEGPVPAAYTPTVAHATFNPARSQVVPVLQKALEDPALEVVIEAAEDLGTLGVSEAGPVLTALLVHPSAPVRQTAAQALERVADLTVLDGLLTALDDPAATVRFSLVGALAHAGGDGHALSDAQRTQILSRLEDLILRDPDPGVRSRAASVLGEVGTPEVLPFLWQRVLTAEDSRVKDKAWAAVMAILVRTGNLELLGDWDQKLARANQSERRLQLLEAAADAWAKNDHVKAPVGAALELLVQAQLENGKWPAALPRLRDLLNRPATDAEMDKRLHLLLEVGRQALKEGNSAESLRVVREAQPFLTRNNKVAGEFEKLEKQAQEGP